MPNFIISLVQYYYFAIFSFDFKDIIQYNAITKHDISHMISR